MTIHNQLNDSDLRAIFGGADTPPKDTKSWYTAGVAIGCAIASWFCSN